jgi:hypothetical protein
MERAESRAVQLFATSQGERESPKRGRYLFMADRPHNGLFILKLSDELMEIAARR